jgi:predicted nucleic acid-binding protein
MTTGAVVRGLIDTPVLIAYRDGWPDPVRFITAVRMNGLPELSELSAMALFTWCQDAADHQGVEVFLLGSIVHRLTSTISRKALNILERLPAPVVLTADDAIVAATAIGHKIPLYTLDPGRFAGISGLTALPPY